MSIRPFGFTDNVADNAWKVAGYFPLVGCAAAVKHWKTAYEVGRLTSAVNTLGSGIANLVNTVSPNDPLGASITNFFNRGAEQDAENSRRVRISLVIRGIFEFLGLGILVGLLLDLPVNCCISQRV